MTMPNDGDEFPMLPQSRQLEPRERYELLLRAVRYLLARHISFTQIEEALVAGGIPANAAEQLIELVMQNLEGLRPAPDAFKVVEVPLAAMTALGFMPYTETALPESLLAVAKGTAPAPEFAFTAGSSVPARAARRGSSPTTLLLTTAIVCAIVLVIILLARPWQ